LKPRPARRRFVAGAACVAATFSSEVRVGTSKRMSAAGGEPVEVFGKKKRRPLS
jgi:hypothetical protein